MRDTLQTEEKCLILSIAYYCSVQKNIRFCLSIAKLNNVNSMSSLLWDMIIVVVKVITPRKEGAQSVRI